MSDRNALNDALGFDDDYSSTRNAKDQKRPPRSQSDAHHSSSRPTAKSNGGNGKKTIAVVAEAQYRKIQALLKKREMELISVIRARKHTVAELEAVRKEKDELSARLDGLSSINNRAVQMGLVGLKNKCDSLERDVRSKNEHVKEQEALLNEMREKLAQNDYGGDVMADMVNFKDARSLTFKLRNVETELETCISQRDDWQTKALAAQRQLETGAFGASDIVLPSESKARGGGGGNTAALEEEVAMLREDVDDRAAEKERMLAKMQELVAAVTKLKEKNTASKFQLVTTKTQLANALKANDELKMSLPSDTDVLGNPRTKLPSLTAGPFDDGEKERLQAKLEKTEKKLTKITTQAHDKLGQAAKLITALKATLAEHGIEEPVV